MAPGPAVHRLSRAGAGPGPRHVPASILPVRMNQGRRGPARLGGVGGRVGCPALGGGGEELAQLRAAFPAAAAGGTRLVLLDAEAGVGKTRLVHEAVREAAAQGFTVLEGACLPLGSAL